MAEQGEITGSRSELLGMCCGKHPTALDCLSMHMGCRAFFDGALQEQSEATGELPPTGTRCKRHCDNLGGARWCGFPPSVGIAIACELGWGVISIVAICWIKKRNKPEPAEPFNPLNEF
jgi:hypothetical protein